MKSNDKLLNDLSELAPPPNNPWCCGSTAQWESLLTENETTLPQDYVEFVKRYGMCELWNFLRVPNPFVDANDGNMFSVQATQNEFFRAVCSGTEFYKKYHLSIERELLIPCLVTSNTDHFFWIASPDISANEWRIAAVDSYAQEYCEYSVSFVHLLLDLFQGKKTAPFIPEDVEYNNRVRVVPFTDKYLAAPHKPVYSSALAGKGRLPKDYVSVVKSNAKRIYLKSVESILHQ